MFRTTSNFLVQAKELPCCWAPNRACTLETSATQDTPAFPSRPLISLSRFPTMFLQNDSIPEYHITVTNGRARNCYFVIIVVPKLNLAMYSSSCIIDYGHHLTHAELTPLVAVFLSLCALEMCCVPPVVHKDGSRPSGVIW